MKWKENVYGGVTADHKLFKAKDNFYLFIFRAK